MLEAAAVRAPADPIAIARALGDRPGLALLASAAPRAARGRFSYVACDPDGATAELDPFEPAGAVDTSPLASAPRFVGTLPYEARRSALERRAWVPAEVRAAPLHGAVEWQRYPAVVVVDHEAGDVRAVGEPSAARELARRIEAAGSVGSAPFRLDARDGEPGALHVERVARAVELIVAGDLYQVNLARRIELSHSGDRLALLAALLAAAPTPFGALVTSRSGAWIASTSPELFLDASPGDPGGFSDLVTEPIKGTRPRGADDEADAKLARALDRDQKERAELAMIVDVERNDMARVCRRGTVVVDGDPFVETHATVHHRVARVRGVARADASRSDVLDALLPSGSVTGAPKIRAMEVIASLEPTRRGIYTGALGFAAWNGSMRLAMAIRTAAFAADGRGEYLVGGGIVADSDPRRELEETRWKAKQIQDVAARFAAV